MLLFGSQSSGVGGKACKGSSTTLFLRLLFLDPPLLPLWPYPNHHHPCPIGRSPPTTWKTDTTSRRMFATIKFRFCVPQVERTYALSSQECAARSRCSEGRSNADCQEWPSKRSPLQAPWRVLMNRGSSSASNPSRVCRRGSGRFQGTAPQKPSSRRRRGTRTRTSLSSRAFGVSVLAPSLNARPRSWLTRIYWRHATCLACFSLVMFSPRRPHRDHALAGRQWRRPYNARA